MEVLLILEMIVRMSLLTFILYGFYLVFMFFVWLYARLTQIIIEKIEEKRDGDSDINP